MPLEESVSDKELIHTLVDMTRAYDCGRIRSHRKNAAQLRTSLSRLESEIKETHSPTINNQIFGLFYKERSLLTPKKLKSRSAYNAMLEVVLEYFNTYQKWLEVTPYLIKHDETLIKHLVDPLIKMVVDYAVESSPDQAPKKSITVRI